MAQWSFAQDDCEQVCVGEVVKGDTIYQSGWRCWFNKNSLLYTQNETTGKLEIKSNAFEAKDDSYCQACAFQPTNKTACYDEATACLFVDCEGNPEWRDYMFDPYKVIDASLIETCPNRVEGCYNTELLYTIEGVNGVYETKWTTNATVDPPRLLPSETIFTDVVDGLPAIDPAIGLADIINQVNTTFTYTQVPNAVDYSILEAWIYVPETTQLRDINRNVETGEIYLSKCGNTLSEVANWNPYNAGEFSSVSAGFYRIKVYIVDDSPDAAGFVLEWNIGGSWGTVPADFLFLEQPTVKCRPVFVCNEVVTELDGTTITLTDFDSWCDPALCGSGSASAASSEENCLQDRTDQLIIDNAGTRFGNLPNEIISITVFDNGQLITLNGNGITFQGTNGINQTAAMADAVNTILTANDYGQWFFENAVLTGDRYYAWAIAADVCPFWTITEVVVQPQGLIPRSVPVDLQEGTMRTIWRRSCEGCNGGYDWVDDAGNTVEKPEELCLVPCGMEYPSIDFPDPTCVTLEPEIFCLDTDGDNAGDLNVYSITTTCDGVIESVETYDLASVSANINDPDAWTTTTIPAGAVSVTCEGAEVVNIEILCDANGTQHEVRTLVFGGVTYRETYVPSTDTPSTPVGALQECPPIGSISEIEICADGKPAIKKTVVNADGSETIQFLGDNGVVFSPKDWVAGQCNCQRQDYYIVEGENGSINQSWTTSAVSHTLANFHQYLLGFDSTDAEGYPIHTKDPDLVTDHTLANTINVNNGAIDQAQLDFYLYLPKGYNLREYTGQADAVGVWVSNCGSDEMTEVVNGVQGSYTNTQPNPIGYYDRGIYRFRLYVTDVTVNGTANIQYEDDLGIWRNIPAEWVFKYRPKEVFYKGWVCCDGVIRDREKEMRIDDSDPLISCEPIVCVPTIPEEEDCTITTLWTFPEGDGASYKYWVTNSVSGVDGVEHNDDLSLVFSNNGEHPNLPSETGTTPNPFFLVDSQTGLGGNSPDPLGVYSNGEDQMEIEGCLLIPPSEGSIQICTWAGNAESGRLYIDGSLTHQWKTPAQETFCTILYGGSSYEIKAQLSDISAFMSFRMGIDTDLDGTPDANIPSDWAYSSCGISPIARKVQICKPSGTITDCVTGETIILGDRDYWDYQKDCTVATTGAATSSSDEANVMGRVGAYWNNNAVNSLGVPAGTNGCLTLISEYGTGVVYYTLDGTIPAANTNGTTMVSGQTATFNEICGIDLSLVRVVGSSPASDYTVQYEIW